MDFDKAVNQITKSLLPRAKKLLDGAADDMQNYVVQIGKDIVEISQIPNSDRKTKLLAELTAQLKAVGEINRIRANNEAWGFFEDAVAIAGELATNIIGSAALSIAIPTEGS